MASFSFGVLTILLKMVNQANLGTHNHGSIN